MKGLEGLAVLKYTQLRLIKKPYNVRLCVVPVGLEPTTYGLENRCSIQLSYGTIFEKYN